MTTFTLDIHSILELTDDQFFELCQRNRDLKFERTSTGELIIMTPTGGETSNSTEICFEAGINLVIFSTYYNI